MSRQAFRFWLLVYASIVLVLPFLTMGPPPLLEFLTHTYTLTKGMLPFHVFVVRLLGPFLAVIGVVGLFFFWRPARGIFLLSQIYLLTIPFLYWSFCGFVGWDETSIGGYDSLCGGSSRLALAGKDSPIIYFLSGFIVAFIIMVPEKLFPLPKIESNNNI